MSERKQNIMNQQFSPIMVPGQILYSSWGYEQTNIDFYQVLKVKNGWATVQKMESISQSDPGGYGMHTIEMPGIVIPSAKPFRRKVKNYGGEDYIMIESYEHASAWNGKPKHATHYA